MSEKVGQLPEELDNETVIFSYGSLLDHEKLRELLKHRARFQIFETGDASEAAGFVKNHPSDIVILKNVRLENVRVSIVTETILRRRFAERGGNLQALIDAEVTTKEIPQALFLCARPAGSFEKGKALNGGLICNLTKDELSKLDKYEFEPVLKRTRATKLKIGERVVVPTHIAFYASSEPFDDITSVEKAERSFLLDLDRKRGEQSPQAKWRRNVRRK